MAHSRGTTRLPHLATFTATFLISCLIAFLSALAGTSGHIEALDLPGTNTYAYVTRETSTSIAPASLIAPDTSEDEVVFVTHIWHCGQDYLGEAPADGSLAQWAPHYFVAHSFGTYGKQILKLIPGDTIVVNDELVTVEGAIRAAKHSAYEQIMNTVGWDATVFQTCIPDTELCLFVYARGANSTIGAANEARTFAGLPPLIDLSFQGFGYAW